MKKSIFASALLNITAKATIATAMIGILSLNSVNAITVYKVTGAHGETKYLQYPPRDTKNYEVIEFRSDGRQVDPGKMANEQAAQQPTPEQQRIAQLEERIKEDEEQRIARQCQTLRSNLTSLNADSEVYERTADGKQKTLNEQERNERKQRTQQALDQYCKGK